VENNYRISGHESFPCRYTWLPKAVQGLSRDPNLFADERQAMVDLGVGKNMVRSIRFWAQAADMIQPAKQGGYETTPIGREILGDDNLDPYLEDIRTLWLIHWNLSTNVQNPLFAWDFLLNRWQDPELTQTRVMKVLQQEAAKQDTKHSPATLEQHFETFLHTYIPTRGRKGEVQEDNLDCPLVELELLLKVGDRELDYSAGRREPIYSFRREEKPEITQELFLYCLNDFWQKRYPNDGTLTFQQIAHAHGSPGQIFKLPDEDIRGRLDRLEQQTGGFMRYAEGATIQQVQRSGQRDPIKLLKKVYSTEVVYE
jgi:hypothetical protein